MTDVYFPAHKICFIAKGGNHILLAATGSCIQSLSYPTGEKLSIWPRDDFDNSSDDEEEQQEDRPSKRQRLSDPENANFRRQDSEVSEASIEIVAEGQRRQKGERRRPKIPDVTLPNVSHLIVTTSGRNAIAITAEDKAVRVFRISRNGRLRQQSLRTMPKKCCAITLTADESTILTADKFGDVYAIPLHPTADYKPKIETAEPREVYKPSATELTVHTKGNLDALRQQQMQKQKQPRKEGLAFEHKLLLGHVSLLTDLAVARGIVDGRPRPFILTSDRDEHIRVSRGIPQTHVIHNFCLGHSDFVSKLCVLPWDEKVLVAGNGEPSLRMYNWQEGKLLHRLDLVANFCDDIEGVLVPTRTMDKLAVSGIWPVSLQNSENALIVALEGVPLLFSFKTSESSLSHMQTLKLDGNVLDLAQSPGQDLVAVSIDVVHKSGSYKEYRTELGEEPSDVQFFQIKRAGSVQNEITIEGLHLERFVVTPSWDLKVSRQSSAVENGGSTENDSKVYSVMGEFIYGLENLRKRRGKVAEEEDEEIQGDDVELEGALEAGS